MVKPGAAVVGAGTTWEGRKLLSDVDESVAEVAGWITPRLGGVGPMTRAMLLRNARAGRRAARSAGRGRRRSAGATGRADRRPTRGRQYDGLVMALISELLAAGPTYSFEFFPPKNDAEQATLVRTLRELEPAGTLVRVGHLPGRAASRQRTHDLVAGMLRTTTLTPMAHLICVAHTRLELAEILVAVPQGRASRTSWPWAATPRPTPTPAPASSRYAVELVELARAIGGFSIGVAAHPAGHPRSPDMRVRPRPPGRQAARWPTSRSPSSSSRPSEYVGLVDDLAARGVHKPVLPGIMPVTSPALGAPHGRDGRGRCPPGLVARLEEAVGARRRRRRAPGGRRAWPPSCARSCSTPARRACTSTRSTGRARPGRSTPALGALATGRPADPGRLAAMADNASP